MREMVGFHIIPLELQTMMLVKDKYTPSILAVLPLNPTLTH